MLGATDEILGLLTWQASVTANLDVVRCIVDNTNTVLGSRLGTADVFSADNNKLIINPDKTIEFKGIETETLLATTELEARAIHQIDSDGNTQVDIYDNRIYCDRISLTGSLTSPNLITSDATISLSLIHISEPTRRHHVSRMPSSA